MIPTIRNSRKGKTTEKVKLSILLWLWEGWTVGAQRIFSEWKHSIQCYNDGHMSSYIGSDSQIVQHQEKTLSKVNYGL